MNLTGVLLLVGGGVAAWFVTQFLLRKDDAVEDRRRLAIKASAKCTANGLPLIAAFCENYAIGGYQEMWQGGKEILGIVADDEKLAEVVTRFLTLQLNKKLDSPDGREAVLTIIEKRLNITIPRAALASPVTELQVTA